MIERDVARFNVYNKTSISVGYNAIAPFDNIDFNVGGSYDTTTYEYTFSKAGTYFIGVSYNTGPDSTNTGNINHMLLRNGVVETIAFTASRSPRQTINSCYLYKFEVGDVIYLQGGGAGPRMNSSSVPDGDIYNSWWGIRMDY